MLPPHIELDDLVRLPNQTLALIDRLPASSDSESEPEESDDENEIVDPSGRLSNWVHQIAFPSTQSTNLITTYDNSSTLAVDDHSHDSLALPNAQLYHPRQPIPEGSAVITVALAGTRILLPIGSVSPIDRSFHPGSLVMRPNSRQSGIVQSVEKKLFVRRVCDITSSTVHQADPQTVFEVAPSELGIFSGLRSGDAVVRGNWVGLVDYFQEDVFVQFADGAIACVPGHNRAIRNIDSRTPDRADFPPFREGLYYPGQRVRAVPGVWLTIALWIRGKYSGSNEGTVKSVCLGDVGVEWIAKNMHADGDDSISLNPEKRNIENVKFQELTPLDAFRGSDWVAGDRAFLLNRDAYLNCSANRTQSGDGETGSSCSPTGEIQHDILMQEARNEVERDWEEDDNSGKEEEMGSRARPSRRGRLTKAHRRARELTQPTKKAGVFSETSMGSTGAFAEDVVQILRTTTTVNVLWQDGSRSEGIPGLELQRPQQLPEGMDFWPGQTVSRRDDDLSDDENGVANPLKRRGILLSMDNNRRTARVKWDSENEMQCEENTEELSVYELASDASNLNIGDVVLHAPIRREANPSKEWVGIVTGHNIGKCTISWHGGKVSDVSRSELIFLRAEDDEASRYSASSDDEEEETSVGEAVQSDSENDINWGLEIEDDEGVSSSGVAIGRGTIRELVDDLRASQICRINFMPDNVTLAVQVAVEEAADMLDGRRRRREQEGSELQMSLDDMRLLANFLVTRATSQLLFASLVQKPDLRANYHNRGEVTREWDTLKTALIVAFDSLAKEDDFESSDIELLEHGFVDGNGEVRETMQIEAPGSEEEQNAKFACNEYHGSVNNTMPSTIVGDQHRVSFLEKFVVVDDLADFHKFTGAASSSAASTRFLSVVNKEWSRLRKSLPNGIFVRVSEQNRRCVRAAIIGPKDTPYADIVFFFDIMMGHRYPTEPPQVWFRSHGRNLNPNLYENGKVCLSILGTWEGDSVESWDAKTSNLLRVLLSLQALVFVDEPYYNEAGYHKQKGTEDGHSNSQIYNESTFLDCIRHMIHTLKKGAVPDDCAEIARSHYKLTGGEILERCRKLLKSESGDETKGSHARSSCEPKEAYSSCGFQRALSRLVPNLEGTLESLDENDDRVRA